MLVIYFNIQESFLGKVLVAGNAAGICSIMMGDSRDELLRELAHQFPQTALSDDSNHLLSHIAQIINFIETPTANLDLPLDIQGTAFQQRIWRELNNIPIGTTASYTDIATRIGAPDSIRAVAKACAANTLAIAIPCHRVIKKNGDVSGYRWGVSRKKLLLEREAATRGI